MKPHQVKKIDEYEMDYILNKIKEKDFDQLNEDDQIIF